MSRVGTGIWKSREPLRIGFMPLSDSAPLIYAKESGLFAQYGLDVELQRECGWGNIRDKVINGDLDAAQAPVTLPFLANLGLDSDPCSCISGMILSLQGNGITLSRRLWDQGAHDPASLREVIYRHWRKRTCTFGVPFPFSSQNFLLHRWLQSAGIRPEHEVRIVPVPQEQMFPTLKLGYIDGYCVGEPWNSMAAQEGSGVCLASSCDLAPGHPEKVLMVRQSFAVGRAHEHERLIAALLEACAFCDEPQNRVLLSDLLAHPQYVNAPAEAIRAGLAFPFESPVRQAESPADLHIFYRNQANAPTDEAAAWVITQLYEFLERKSPERTYERAPILKNIFRRDLFAHATTLVQPRAKAVNREENMRRALSM